MALPAVPGNMVDPEGFNADRVIVTVAKAKSYANSCVDRCVALATAAKYSPPGDATETAINADLDTLITALNAEKFS